MRKRLLLVDATDFSTFPMGGQLTFLKEFIKFCTPEIEIYGLGLGRPGEKLGVFKKYRLQNKEINFMPIMNIKGNHDHKIPLSLRYMFSAFFFLSEIKEIKPEFIYVHRTGFDIPFWHLGIPIVLHIHGTAEYAAKYSKYSYVRFFWKIYELIVHQSFKKSHMIFGVDKNTIEVYCQKFPKMRNKFLYIPNFFDPNFFTPVENKPKIKEKYGYKPDDRIIIYLGRLSKKKRVDLLIDVFSQLTNRIEGVKLLIVGEGEEREILEKKVRDYHMKGKVIFYGVLEHFQVPEIINCADIFAFLSEAEGFSISVIECLACGVPGICSNSGAAPFIIKDRFNGFLIGKEKGPIEIAAKMEELLEISDRLTNNCVASVSKYSSEIVVRHICEYLLKLRKS